MKTNQKIPKTLTVFLTLSIAGLMTDVVWASSGRTDSNGCHNSRKEGYHCHGSGPGSGSSPSLPASGSSPSTTTPGGGGGSGTGICLTYDLCMERGRFEVKINNSGEALNFFQQALLLKPGDIEAFTSIHVVEPTVKPISGSCISYKNCMDLGNLAATQQNHQTALVNFKRALGFKLGDKPAINAIRNTCQRIQETRTRN